MQHLLNFSPTFCLLVCSILYNTLQCLSYLNLRSLRVELSLVYEDIPPLHFTQYVYKMSRCENGWRASFVTNRMVM